MFKSISGTQAAKLIGVFVVALTITLVVLNVSIAQTLPPAEMFAPKRVSPRDQVSSSIKTNDE